MTRKLTLIAAVLTLALSAVAGSALANGGAHSAASKTITLRDSYFSPKSITVSKGTSLRFVWAGKLRHNLVGPGANYGFRTKGSATVRATRSGIYKCDLHLPGMKLSVKVR